MQSQVAAKAVAKMFENLTPFEDFGRAKPDDLRTRLLITLKSGQEVFALFKVETEDPSIFVFEGLWRESRWGRFVFYYDAEGEKGLGLVMTPYLTVGEMGSSVAPPTAGGHQWTEESAVAYLQALARETRSDITLDGAAGVVRIDLGPVSKITPQARA